MLYTFIADCDGDTFVSQHEGQNESSAFIEWYLNPSEHFIISIYGSGKKEVLNIEKLESGMNELVKVENLQGVFGGYLRLYGKDIFLFVVETNKKS